MPDGWAERGVRVLAGHDRPAGRRGPEVGGRARVRGVEDDGGDRPGPGVLVPGFEHAQLVALGVGEHDPRHVLLADVHGHGPGLQQARHDLGLVVLGRRRQVEVDPVLAHLGVVHRDEREGDPVAVLVRRLDDLLVLRVVDDRPPGGLGPEAGLRAQVGGVEDHGVQAGRHARCLPDVGVYDRRVGANGDRERLAATFDRAAALYHRARPDYPPAIYDRLLAVTGLAPPARLLEIGCATGKATLPLAERGFAITCLEPGPALAAVARANLAAHAVEVVEARFEDWTPPARPFALVFAATAWHWLDPDLRDAKAAAVLERGGHLALWGTVHVFPRGGDPFFEELQDVYDEIDDSPPAASGRGPRSCRTTAPPSRRAGCSRSSTSRSTTGRSPTTPTATSTCWTPSPGTST